MDEMIASDNEWKKKQALRQKFAQLIADKLPNNSVAQEMSPAEEDKEKSNYDQWDVVDSLVNAAREVFMEGDADFASSIKDLCEALNMCLSIIKDNKKPQLAKDLGY